MSAEKWVPIDVYFQTADQRTYQQAENVSGNMRFAIAEIGQQIQSLCVLHTHLTELLDRALAAAEAEKG